MQTTDISAAAVAASLTAAGSGRGVCILDSCGVGRPGSNRQIAGIDPVEVVELTGGEPELTLKRLNELLNADSRAAVFTLSYDLGRQLIGLPQDPPQRTQEPTAYVALYDTLLVHDYDEGVTAQIGNTPDKAPAEILSESGNAQPPRPTPAPFVSNFSRSEYIAAVEEIKELICRGETYQTNLTQQIKVPLVGGDDAGKVFLRLRGSNPAPFAAYIDRGRSAAVSASPEEFIHITHSADGRQITASPIKGTRPRGRTAAEDARLRDELLSSGKDRAENTMIVDLMRNDLGRICKFGSVTVGDLCRLEEHPTLYHLVSTVTGTLRDDVSYSDILRAIFPCGSITGAPKIRTMEIIDRLEPDSRGLSMGAVGCRIPAGWLGAEVFEMSVAIRTMVISDRTAVFNVGGGIVIDSDPQVEYEESMLKAKALLTALGAAPGSG